MPQPAEIDSIVFRLDSFFDGFDVWTNPVLRVYFEDPSDNTQNYRLRISASGYDVRWNGFDYDSVYTDATVIRNAEFNDPTNTAFRYIDVSPWFGINPVDSVAPDGSIHQVC